MLDVYIEAFFVKEGTTVVEDEYAAPGCRQPRLTAEVATMCACVYMREREKSDRKKREKRGYLALSYACSTRVKSRGNGNGTACTLLRAFSPEYRRYCVYAVFKTYFCKNIQVH